ncbi:MAG: lysophospholipid acyltransferase family protein [Gammaproteobacteria bacterium]
MLKQTVMGDLAHGVTKCIFKSLRSYIFAHPSVQLNQPLILSFWHGKLFLPIMVVSSWQQKKIAGLVSQSRDGAILTRWIERLGFKVVRGSSNRKGASSVVKLIELAKAGYSLGIAADGPRGPIYCAKSGSAYLAQKTGLPILPIGAAYLTAKQFHSWDRFLLPLPFSKATIYLSELIHVKKDDDLERTTQLLELSLSAADARAALLLKDSRLFDEAMNEIKITKKKISIIPRPDIQYRA